MPCLVSALERVAEIFVGVLGEIGDADVAGRAVDHERRRQARDAHLIAHHAHFEQPLEALAAHADVDERALRSLELVDRRLGRPALGADAFDGRDHVAAANAAAERRRAFEHAHGGDVAVDGLNREAEAVVAAFLPLAHLRVGPRVHEARMRIERLQHAVDRAVDHPVGLDRFGVLRLDRGQRRGKGLVVIRNRVGGGKGALPVNPSNEGGNHDGDNGGDGRSAAHRAMVTAKPPAHKDGGRVGIWDYTHLLDVFGRKRAVPAL